MEFAKYYNVTNKLNQMLEQGDILFSYVKDLYKGLYICMDTHDFWICRIQEGYNKEFEQEEGKWLVERNKIDKYAFIDFLEEKHETEYNVTDRRSRDNVIHSLTDNYLVENLILMDDDNGLEGWDNYDADSLEEAIELIDDGYGIIEFAC